MVEIWLPPGVVTITNGPWLIGNDVKIIGSGGSDLTVSPTQGALENRVDVTPDANVPEKNGPA